MNAPVNVYQLGFYVLLGAALAMTFLFYCRRFPATRRYHLFAIALLIASCVYVLFALSTMNKMWITVEAVGLLLFVMFVWMAYYYSRWFIVLGWLLHMVWDIGIHPYETAPYVPQWYAWVCVGFDVVIALFVIRQLVRQPEKA